jgi:hypothetical protein
MVVDTKKYGVEAWKRSKRGADVCTVDMFVLFVFHGVLLYSFYEKDNQKSHACLIVIAAAVLFDVVVRGVTINDLVHLKVLNNITIGVFLVDIFIMLLSSYGFT